MSEPDSAQIGRSIGDNKEDNIEDDAVACCAATGTARQPDFAQHQGQVGHRGRQIHLESRLDPTEVTGLPDAQLDQSRQPVFCHHPALSVLVVVGALLQSPCLLQEGLLRMDLHSASFTALGRNASGPQRARPTDLPIKLEGLQSTVLWQPSPKWAGSSSSTGSPGCLTTRLPAWTAMVWLTSRYGTGRDLVSTVLIPKVSIFEVIRPAFSSIFVHSGRAVE